MDTQIARKTVDQFRSPRKNLGALDADAAAKLLAASSDIAIVIDEKGVIRDLAFGSEELAREGYQSWLSKPWVETVTIESRPKIEEMLANAGAGTPRWRQVNHPTLNGKDVPIRYAAVQVNDSGRIVAIGRDLRSVAAMQQRLIESQQSLEREYAKLRQAETRYRLLFEVSSEAVVIVHAESSKIAEVNPAAVALLAKPAKRITGLGVEELFDANGGRRLLKHLEHISVAGRGDEIKIKLAGSKQDVLVGASLFRQDSSAYFLVRLITPSQDATRAYGIRASVSEVIEKLPDAFVVTDLDRRLISANVAFVELAQAASFEQIRGESIERWLGRQAVDVNILFGSLKDHGVIRGFSTVFRGQYGMQETVEVAGAAVTNADLPCFGLSIRTVQRRAEPIINSQMALPRSVEQLTGLVGQVSLKDLVRESTDLIERLCIEAALELTGDNRASAAEMLGLSRQGLYSKLRRYGIDDLDGSERS